MRPRSNAWDCAFNCARLRPKPATTSFYGDESEATHPYSGAGAGLARRGKLRVPAPGQAKKVAIIGSLDHVTRQLIVHTSQTKRSRDLIAHLEQLDHLFGLTEDGQ